MFKVSIGDYSLMVHRGPLPSFYGDYRSRAALVEEFGLDAADGEMSFVAASTGAEWPALVVAQRFEPFFGGFDPGVLLVPETKVLFIGAGTRLLAYRLDGPSRLWADTADLGFWGWERHGSYVLMSGELELAAWDVHGEKRWATFVEPPWSYRVVGAQVHLDVMGRLTDFSLSDGPPPP